MPHYSRFRQESKGTVAQKAARTNFVRLLQSNCTPSVFPGRDPCFQSSNLWYSRNFRIHQTKLFLTSRGHHTPLVAPAELGQTRDCACATRHVRLRCGTAGPWDCPRRARLRAGRKRSLRVRPPSSRAPKRAARVPPVPCCRRPSPHAPAHYVTDHRDACSRGRKPPAEKTENGKRCAHAATLRVALLSSVLILMPQSLLLDSLFLRSPGSPGTAKSGRLDGQDPRLRPQDNPRGPTLSATGPQIDGAWPERPGALDCLGTEAPL